MVFLSEMDETKEALTVCVNCQGPEARMEQNQRLNLDPPAAKAHVCCILRCLSTHMNFVPLPSLPLEELQ